MIHIFFLLLLIPLLGGSVSIFATDPSVGLFLKKSAREVKEVIPETGPNHVEEHAEYIPEHFVTECEQLLGIRSRHTVENSALKGSGKSPHAQNEYEGEARFWEVYRKGELKFEKQFLIKDSGFKPKKASNQISLEISSLTKVPSSKEIPSSSLKKISHKKTNQFSSTEESN